MSAPITDGGPAFPAPMFTRQADGMPMCPQEFGLGGMTLRDWFAGQALMGSMASDTEQWQVANVEDRATMVYLIADAMLIARERKGGAA